MDLENKKYLSFAHLAADTASKVLIQFYKSKNIRKAHKNRGIKKELVTNIDVRIEKNTIRLIKQYFPYHNVLGEESGFTGGKSDFTWIIDPIDGTKAFASGIPFFGFMISLKYKDEIILGLVDQPILRERYWNYNNFAFLNNKKIKTSNIRKISDASLVCTEPNMFSNYSELHKHLFKKFNLVRWGTDVMGYMRCAEGIVDAVIERNIKLWDVAAVEPIIKMAGGEITTWNGDRVGSNDTVCASNNKYLHQKLLKNLQKFI